MGVTACRPRRWDACTIIYTSLSIEALDQHCSRRYDSRTKTLRGNHYLVGVVPACPFYPPFPSSPSPTLFLLKVPWSTLERLAFGEHGSSMVDGMRAAMFLSSRRDRGEFVLGRLRSALFSTALSCVCPPGIRRGKSSMLSMCSQILPSTMPIRQPPLGPPRHSRRPRTVHRDFHD